MKRSAALFLFLLVLATIQRSDPGFAQGATFYVSTSGLDTNPGTIGSPWRTIQKATNTLTAGQTALVRGGTYNEHDITFTNSGSAGNPITLKGYPGETAIIDGGYTTSSGTHPVFFLDGRFGFHTLSYWVIDGLTVQRGSTANFYVAQDDAVDNLIIRNSVCLNYVSEDNAACIYVNPGATNITITKNLIHGRINGGSSPTSGSGIIAFRVGNLTITNNEIYDQIYGIQYKHNDPGSMTTLVENNFIHDTTSKGLLWTTHNAVIRNNVIYSTPMAIKVYEDAGNCASTAANNNLIVHNTIVDNPIGISLETGACAGAVNTVVKDNLLFNFTNGEYRGIAIFPFVAASDTSSTTLDHNLISTAVFGSPVRVLGAYYTLASIPLTVTKSGNISSTPTFQNYAGRNYALLPGGPEKNAP